MTKPFERYLGLLGVQRRPSGLDGLRDLTRRHLARVPFENISKLLLYHRERRGRLTTLHEFLDGIECFDLGGTCYTNNPFFAELLRELGYAADLLGADMSRPNVHTCIRVRLDGRACLVDVGFAAPFRDPMPLDGLPFELTEGANRYRLEAGGRGGWRMDMYRGADRLVGYVAHLPPRTREFFAPVVEGSYVLTSTFLRSLRISRVYSTHSLDLMGRTLYRHEAGATTGRELGSMAELVAAVRGDLGMPRCPVETAVAVLEELSGVPLF